MLSVIIPTRNSERALVSTLASLVSGATAGLITEVILADGGSRDDTAKVADVAGCKLLVLDAPLATRLKAAAAAARAPWLMFLRPGTVLDSPWTGDAARFVQQTAGRDRAAVFRRSELADSAARAMALLVTALLHRRADPGQGLLLANRFYEALGGHSEQARDPETDLIRRIGRSRIATLSTAAFTEILD